MQGDARDILNTKRAGQQLIDGSEIDKKSGQQVCDDLSKETGVNVIVDVPVTAALAIVSKSSAVVEQSEGQQLQSQLQ